MTAPTASVLLPSYRRPEALATCLASLAAQDRAPDQTLVVWQGDDVATRDAACRAAERLALPIQVLHSPTVGIVPAENTALEAATGDIVLLIDDDATAPPDWLSRHLGHFADPTVGAVGGPAANLAPDGTPFPARGREPVGLLTWYGRAIGNMYDHPAAWRARPPAPVDHLVGNNMSLRRSGLDRFESGLRPYWQHFELDACLQVARRGYRVLFDFGNVVTHRPTNPAYAPGRSGDLQVKVYHAAYNRALVLAKHSPPSLRLARFAFPLAVGSASVPGVLGALVGTARYGHPLRELRVLWNTWRYHLAGWRAGARLRGSTS